MTISKPTIPIEPKTRKKRQAYQTSLLWGGMPVALLYLLDMLGWLPQATLPEFPHNLYIGMALANILLFVWVFFKQTAPVKWIVSVPASVSAIVWFSLLVLLMGFIPQGNDPQGPVHQRLVGSWPMAFAAFFLLVTLGTVTLKRTIPFRFSNLGFILNHFGLWVTLVAALLGSSDLKRLQVGLQEGTAGNTAFDAQNQAYRLPFTLELQDFQMETFPPKILLANPRENKFVKPESTFYQEVAANIQFTMEGWELQVLEYLPDAIPQADDYLGAAQVGAAPAVKIAATHPSGKQITGWAFAGSFRYDPQYLALQPDRWLAILPGEAKSFRSEISALGAGGEVIQLETAVNKPIDFNGWMIYQSGYREEWGKWSDYSVLELVRDPWLPIVYSGIFLMIFGAVYLMVQGKKAEKEAAV